MTPRPAALVLVSMLAGCGTDAPTPPDDAGAERTPPVVVTAVRWEARQRVGDAGERRFGRCSPYSNAQCRLFNEAIAPAVASNARGDVAALWQRWEGDAYRLASARQLPGGGWTEAVSVSAETGLTDHQLALDGRGEALALWDQQPNGTRSSRGTPAGTWGAPEPVVGVPGRPELAMDPDGTAHLLFARWNDGLYAMRRPAGSAWGTPVRIQPQGPASIDDTRLSVEPGGGPLAVWMERFQGNAPAGWTEVWSSRGAGERWTAPSRVARFDGPVAYQLALAATGGGALAFYQVVERQTDFPDLWRVFEQHDTGTAWSAPAPVADPPPPRPRVGRSRQPVVAADAAGTIMLAWTEDSYGSLPYGERYRVLARRYVPATGALEPTRVIEDVQGFLRDSYGPHVVASAAGDAIVVWVQHGVPFTLRASAFVPGRGWMPPETLTIAERLTDISVAMDARGVGVVAWAEPEGDRATVFSVRLAAETVPARQ